MSYKHLILIILIALTPVMLYGQLFEWILSPVVPTSEVSDILWADGAKRALFAKEFPARVSLALVCLVLGVCSFAALAYAVWLVHSKAGAKIAVGLVVLAVGAGSVSYLTNDFFDDSDTKLSAIFAHIRSESSRKRDHDR